MASICSCIIYLIFTLFLFRLTHTCFNKCIENKYKESELNMGENSCIDRCVSKYWQVTNLVGQLLGNNRPPM
ncbi:mitochondrial import inner membrane translocase subunit TIM10-like [Olea europaea subsp. europaea]|uniref:Mitochondrial import inner membrane translocase subunit n=1 Tax=Olea europaea subsp. europaea TaxID=158383 RepID=A0A8S0THX3_OLEEU|nr:mitochondrial import inner membrane translocase subunit TIM10-like [Olea europaea subsp. europaea]